jgi:hypothetical protein
LFLSKKRRKQAAAIRLLPSTKAWFFTIKYNNNAAFSSIEGYRSKLPNDCLI